VALAGVQLIGVAAVAGRLVLFLVGWSACRLRAHEKGYIFITLGYPILAIALLSSRRAIAAAGVSV
jgi:hypothetical protein